MRPRAPQPRAAKCPIAASLAALLSAALACSTGACSTETFSSSVADAGALPFGDGGAETGPLDAADDSAPGSCPAGMVHSALSCIDAHEVTNADYQRFLESFGANPNAPVRAGLPAGCAFKVTDGDFVPPTLATEVAVGPTKPVSVDWCEAVAYCAWAGKHLCGRPASQASGVLTQEDLIDPSRNEWYEACSRGGTRAYPYGGTLADAATGEVGRCVLNGPATLAVDRAGNACEGGYEGLFDMVGNTEEWVRSCEGPAESDRCIAMGGAFNDDLHAACTKVFDTPRSERRPDVGFRCCK
jgi:formylglycine-generating enzyme required for sulfatase activity